MPIPESFIQDLLSRVDVVDVVGRYVQLKKGGANHSGLCPFHGEKSPSFTVTQSKQFFHCFGCGKNGDAIRFLMEHNGLSFVEAIKELAGQVGLQVPDDRASPQARAQASAQREHQVRLVDVLERAAGGFQKQLRGSARAVEYLRGRGVTGEVAKRFGLGYAAEGWRGLASVFPDYADRQLVDAGLVIEGDDDKRYDRFRDRVMFPIRNVKGECIGFGGRVLGDGTPKYLNSPETPVFSKGRELYGLFEARDAIRERGHVLVTEGYMDVVALAQLGFPQAVATLGTACTNDHVQKLFRFTDSVVFSFDGDAAGRRAARKALECALPFASDVRSVRFLFLPAEHDPDTFVRERGSEAFQEAVSAATPLSKFLVDVARQDCDLAQAEGRARMAANARPLWQQLPAGVLRQQLLVQLGQLTGLGAIEISKLWGVTAPPAARPSRESRAPTSGAAWMPPAESRLARLLQVLLADSAAWERLGHDNQALLCAQAAPYGPIFSWLDRQVQEVGPQPWMTLCAALRGHEHEPFALRQMERAPSDAICDVDELDALLAGLQRRPVTST